MFFTENLHTNVFVNLINWSLIKTLENEFSGVEEQESFANFFIYKHN